VFMSTPRARGVWWLLLIGSITTLVFLMVSRQRIPHNQNPSACFSGNDSNMQEAIYFPFRICLDGDSVRTGCIYGLNIHLDNIGSECILDSVLIEDDSYRANVINPTTDERWLVVNDLFHANWNARLNNVSLAITRVNHTAMGVLVPPRTSGIIQFTYASTVGKGELMLSLVGLFAMSMLLMSALRHPKA